MIFLGAGGTVGRPSSARTNDKRPRHGCPDDCTIPNYKEKLPPFPSECWVDSHSGFGASDQQIDDTAVVERGILLAKLAERFYNRWKKSTKQQRPVEKLQLHLHRHEAYLPGKDEAS
jgi:hypothetical protein